ncbi:MAG: transposase [Bacillota bacterium]
MMKMEFGKKIYFFIDKLYNEYPDGIVAHIKMEKVSKYEKLAKYLMKYVGSHPIALSRINEYNKSKQTYEYWYKDHRTLRRKKEDISVMTFIGRMVQYIFFKGV